MSVQENAGRIVQCRFCTLFLSHLNVRKDADESELDIDPLADNIVAQGVIQNLVGYEEAEGKGRRKTTKIGVVAGGRRFRGIDKAISQGRLPPDFEVPVLITTKERAVALSLSENTGRKDLNPADEFVAFRDLVNEGKSFEEIAAAFGVTPAVVKRRLRLANVHPDLFAMFRKGAIKLNYMMVLASADDTIRQQAAWKAFLELYGERHGDLEEGPSLLRDLLTESETTMARPIAKFVGLEAYQAAGGAVRTDIFAESDEAATVLMDVRLVETLANERLQVAVNELGSQAGAWVKTCLHLSPADLASYRRVRLIKREPTVEESEELGRLSSEIDAAWAEIGESDEPEREVTEEREHLDALEADLERLEDQLKVEDPGELSASGTIVCVSPDGNLLVHRGLLTQDDAKRLRQVETKEPETAAPDLETSAGVKNYKLVQRLSAYRSQALQSTIASNSQLALALLCQHYVAAVLFEEAPHLPVLTVEIDVPRLAAYAEDIEHTKAHAEIEHGKEEWLKRIPADLTELLPWLLQQSEATVGALLAFCVGLTLNTVEGHKGAAGVTDLVKVTGLDMADRWVPSASFLSKVRKEEILQIVATAISSQQAASIEGLKKPVMVATAEKLLANARWIPDYYKQ